ncbi:ABC transporter permease [Necropsobacter rosorum]|uniref:ABC transporter permease n=1 Tax=Necropsobacter rosorum TaxID=908285 RepID=UPI000A6C7514
MNKLKGKLQRFYAFDELLKQLVLRDIKLKYRRSYLGYLWSILNPLLLMTVLVLVFSNLFQRNVPNFPLYLISGQILFYFMVEATNSSVTSIRNNSSLIKKTYVPKYIFTLSKVGSSVMNLLFSLGALLLVMIFTRAEVSWYLLLAPFVLIQVATFSLGISLFLAAFTVFFRDIQYLWGVFTTMWMYMTPIFYPTSIIPERFLAWYKGLNPMYWYIEQFRDIILYTKMPHPESIMIGCSIALVSLILGTWYFNKKQDEFILYI